jgi:hypothetical protein
MTVYAIQQPVTRRDGEVVPAFDFSPAQKYGEIVVLLQNSRGALAPEVLLEQLKERLGDFDPTYDYIIPAGDYAICFVVGMTVAKFGFVRILRWIPEAKAYQPITIDIRK